MTTFLKIAAVAATLIVPMAAAQAAPQGSDEAQGNAQSWGARGYGNGGIYARYHGRHHRF